MTPLPDRSRFRVIAALVLILAASTSSPLPASAAAAMPLAQPMALRAAMPSVLLRVKSDCEMICTKWMACAYWISIGFIPKRCIGPNGEPLWHKFYCVGRKKVCSHRAVTHPPSHVDRPPSAGVRNQGLLEGEQYRLPPPSVTPRAPGLNSPRSSPRLR